MKRDPSLVPLSWDHHTGLSIAKRIPERLDAGAAPRQLFSYVLYHWNAHLKSHFDKKEQLLVARLPGEARAGALNRRVLDEHAMLGGLLQAMGGAEEAQLERLLREFAERLKAHIRFEESEYFPLVESLLPEDELARLGELLEREHRPVNPADHLP
jgi:hypothetical protein